MNQGEQIKKLRLSKGVTQKYIVNKLGKSSGWLSQIESGTKNISAEDLKLISELLDIRIELFFLGVDFTNSKVAI